MSTVHVLFEARLPTPRRDLRSQPNDEFSRSRVLDQFWRDRRTIDWRISQATAPAPCEHATRHKATLALDCPRTSLLRTGTVTLAIDVDVPDGEDPVEKARRLLDLPIDAPVRWRQPRSGISSRGSFHHIRQAGLIGPMPDQWPVGRYITGYSHYLGSYGQGGVGLSGWQLNNGSWMILPLGGSDSWITLTMEELAWARDSYSVDIVIDQRIIGVHPSQKPMFPPWEHRYCGSDTIEDLPDFSVERPRITRFEAAQTGFVLETGGANRTWRFAIGAHLPRPIWPGTGEPREFLESENLADSFVLAHDCYLDV